MPRTPDDGSGPLDVDAAFAEIVAHWDEDAPVQRGRHRRSTDATDHADDNADDNAHDGATDGGGEAAPDGGPDAAADATGAGADQGRHSVADVPQSEPAPDETARPQAAGPPPQEPRLVKPVAPLPPAPREDAPTARPGERRPREEEPAELRGLTEEEGFTPAEPGPLPRDVLGWAAWIAVVGAPLFLLVVALGWREVPRLVTVITAGIFIAGFATLVIRLPSSRDDDDDDGAVV